MMLPERLTLLVQTPITAITPLLAQELGVTLATIQELKTLAQHYIASDSAFALQLATAAQHWGGQLPAPAPGVGHWAMGNTLLDQHRFLEAAEHYALARADHLAVGLALDAARLGVGHVGALAYTGECAAGLQLAAEIEPYLVEAGKVAGADLRRLGLLRMNVGVIHELTGQYEAAVAVYEQQLALAERLDDQLLWAQLRHNQALAFVAIGAFDEAARCYQQAEPLLQALNEPVELVRLYTNYGELLTKLRRYSEAQAAQEKAATLLTTLDGMDQQRHWLTLQRVWTTLASGAWPDAQMEADLTLAQLAFATHGPAFIEAFVWLAVGYCALRRQNWPQTKAALQQAQTLAEGQHDRALQSLVQHGWGQWAAAQGFIDQARQHFQMSIELLESMRYELQVETFRADFLSDRLVVYHDLAQLEINAGHFGQAFQVIEQAKARLLSEKLADRLQIETTRLNERSDAMVTALSQTMSATLRQLDQLYQQTRLERLHEASDLPSAPATATVSQIRALEEQVNGLIRQIQQREPRFYALQRAAPFTVEQLQRHLQEEIFLQFHVWQDQVGVLMISREGAPVYQLLGSLAAIERVSQTLAAAIRRLLEAVVRYGPERIVTRQLPGLLADVNRRLQELYELLLRPLAPLLPPGAPLLVALAGPLHYVPIHALYDGAAYFIEHRPVIYAPSATVLDLCLQPIDATAGALIVGYDDNRLGAVTTELAMLRAAFPTAQVLTGAQATTQQLLDHAPQRRLLHLAAHAQFRTDNPMLSSIALADRRLTLAEIARLHLAADLVVLSGCETGYGQLRGADLLSLAGGFLGAGARSMLVSLWPVEDGLAADFMDCFYRTLLAGAPRAYAVQQAQLTLLNQGRAAADARGLYRHPAYWAPFTLLGNWHALPNAMIAAA